MTPLEPAPALIREGVMIGHSELMRVFMLVLVLRGVIDRQTLSNIVEKVRGGIKERGYDQRYIADADRYVRDILAQVQSQLEAIQRLNHENEKPQ
jgi:hypothetical protein